MRQLVLAIWVTFLPIQNDFGRLEVTVRDAGTRQGVVGVPVTLTASTGNEVRIPEATVLTDPRGVAVFPSLPLGTYFLKSDGTGYKPLSFTQYLFIEAGVRKTVEIPINQAAIVTGRVLDPAGKPLPGSTVYLLTTVYVGGRPALRSPGRLSETRADGSFRFADIPFGEYYLQIDNSAALAQPRATDLPRYIFYPAATEFSGAAKLAVQSREVSVGNIQIPNTQVFKISGTVISTSGQPSASFYLAPASASRPIEPSLLFARITSSTDRGELPFEIGGLVPGSYVLYHVSRSPSTELVGRVPITVEDRDVEGIRFLVKPNAEIRGHVLWGSLASELFGNVSVSVQPKEILPPLIGVSVAFSPHPIDRSGVFVVPEMVEGVRYGISVLALPVGAYVSDVRLGNASILNEGSFVARSSEDSLEIHIASPGGTFGGTVRAAANQAVPKATVVVVPDWIRHGNSIFYRRVTSDANGQFTVSGIAPGEYQIFAFAAAPPAGAEEDADFMAQYVGKGLSVRATAGAAIETPLRLIP